jgi:hypothetical protein
MKKTILTTIFLFLLITISAAQNRYTDLKFGFLAPADAKTGFLGAFGMGKQLDENISFGFELDYYRKSYTKKSKVGVDQGGEIRESTYKIAIENSVHMFPLMGHISYLNRISPKLDLKISAGLGYSLLWNNEKNYEEGGKEKRRFYSGWIWNFGGGVSYPLSRNSDIYAEVLYFGGSPSRDEGENETGLPLFAEVDMSGVSMRVGIRLFNFGF